MRKFFLVALVGIFLGGCAIGNKHRYDLGDADLKLDSEKSVAVTVVDLRPYILDGEKTPDFVGLQRGGFGNPFDITTDSGAPLAEELTNSIVASLKAGGTEATAVIAAPKTSEDDARDGLLAASADRFALLSLLQWKTDTYLNTGLRFSIKVSVLQKNGTELAKNTFLGEENLGPTLVPADARVQAETAIRQKLEAIFSEASIKAALE